MGILRIMAFGLIGFSFWAGMRAQPPELSQGVPQRAARSGPLLRPSAYPFPPRPTSTPTQTSTPTPPGRSLVAILPAPAKEEVIHASVVGDAVIIRSQPKKRSAALGKLDAGAKVRVLEQRGSWVRVQPEPPFRQGWMSTRYVLRSDAKPLARMD